MLCSQWRLCSRLRRLCLIQTPRALRSSCPFLLPSSIPWYYYTAPLLPRSLPAFTSRMSSILLFLLKLSLFALLSLQGDELNSGFRQMSLSRQGSSEAPEPPSLYPPPPAVLSQHPPPQPSYIMPPPPSGYQPAAPHQHPPPPPPPPTQPIMQTAPPAQGYMQPPPPPQQVVCLTPVVSGYLIIFSSSFCCSDPGAVLFHRRSVS